MIYLIRHGLTEWNTGGLFRGRHDIPLSEEGRRQAHLLGKHIAEELKGVRLPVIYSSPLSRAYETASIVAGYTDAKVVSEESLIDVDFGDWQGKNASEVEKQYPDSYRMYRMHPEKATFPGGESLEGCFNRCMQGFFGLAGATNGKLTLVSHRVILKLILIGVLELPLSAFWRIQLDTCSLNTFEMRGGTFVIKKINSTCHLSEGLDYSHDF